MGEPKMTRLYSADGSQWVEQEAPQSVLPKSPAARLEMLDVLRNPRDYGFDCEPLITAEQMRQMLDAVDD